MNAPAPLSITQVELVLWGEATRLPQLRELLWQGLGPVRDRDGMARARAQCEPWGETWQARLAGALLEAGLRRRLSVGAHYRSDEDRVRPGLAHPA